MGGIFPQPGFSLKLLLSGPNSQGGSETPKGPPLSVLGGTPNQGHLKGMPSATLSPGGRVVLGIVHGWRCLGPLLEVGFLEGVCGGT